MSRATRCARCRASLQGLHGNRRYCNECFGEAKIIRGKATCKVVNAIVYGKLKPIRKCRCVDCGKRAQIYEHRSYFRPLDVVPVCRRCNHKRGPADWSEDPSFLPDDTPEITPPDAPDCAAITLICGV